MSNSILDGKRFMDLFIAGSKRLDESKEYLDSINVFPVPDADTGANMASTMNTAVEALHELDDHSLSAVLDTIAHKLRMEARGNSGIILSEFFHGMFQRIKDEDAIRRDTFVEAMDCGKEAAYQALADPREGTILTVMSQAVDSLKMIREEIDDMATVLEHMVESQKRAVAQTQEMMPLLKENHVVDSGAHGFLLFWEGALAYMNNEIDHVILKPIRKVFKTDKADKIKYRYCTEALVRGASFERKGLCAELVTRGDSLIITGDGALLKIHIHTNEPTEVLDYMGGLGTVVKTKVDDMMDQHRDKVKEERKQAVRVVVDSTCDLDLSLREEYDIEMAPLQVIFGDEAFRDRIDLTADEFYGRLKRSNVHPTTSLPRGSDFVECFEHIAPYCDTILCIWLSSELSGTYQAGKKWGDEFDGAKVVARDSRSASLGTGLVALEAARMARDGEPLERIETRIEDIRKKTHLYFTVDTLEFLARSGRIGQAKKMIGQLIGMKPILKCQGGKVCSFTKALGRKAMLEKLLGQLEKDARADDFEGHYGVVWSDNPEARDEFTALLKERLTINSLITGQISPVIGAHVGPGALGVVCY